MAYGWLLFVILTNGGTIQAYGTRGSGEFFASQEACIDVLLIAEDDLIAKEIPAILSCGEVEVAVNQ